MRPPRFWYPPAADANEAAAGSAMAATTLAPLGWLYGRAGRLRQSWATPYASPLPVICIGNLTVGGTGKTPVAIALADRLKSRGRRPVFLTRGYGGTAVGPVQADPTGHRVADVGDEALLLAAHAPTVVARDRADGARFAERERLGDVIVMDDGFQNPGLAKTAALLVVDAHRGFGNGLCVPAGPLREPIAAGLARADAVIVMQRDGDRANWRRPDSLAGCGKPVVNGWTEMLTPPQIHAQRIVAFAGIGDPDKFFQTAEKLGVPVAARVPFPDHHVYGPDDAELLRVKALRANAALVTTTKDATRLPVGFRKEVYVIEMEVKFESNDTLDAVLTAALDRPGDAARAP